MISSTSSSTSFLLLPDLPLCDLPVAGDFSFVAGALRVDACLGVGVALALRLPLT